MIDLKAIRAAAEADKGQDRAFILLSVDILALLDRLEAAEEALEQPAQEPVASIYITPDGQREVDDWKVSLPVGRNELYAVPQPIKELPLSDEQCCACDGSVRMVRDPDIGTDQECFVCGGSGTGEQT